MSENRNIGVDLKDKERKRLKDFDHVQQQEKEMEKAKEGIASSSTLLEIASGTEVSEKMIMKPTKKHSHVTQGHDQSHIDVLSQSKLGVYSINKRNDPLLTSPTKKFEFKGRVFLFEMLLTPLDVEQGRLFIPVEIALHHFPPLPEHSPITYEEKVLISSTRQDRVWFMTVMYDPEECAFLVNSEWKLFSESHNAKARDMILFYRPVLRSQDNHYLIQHLKVRNQEGDEEIISSPLFMRESFLFQRKVTPNEVIHRRLVFSKMEVRNYFPGIRIPVETHYLDRLYVTDAANKEWCFKIMFYFETYLVISGWEGFVNEYKVEVGDVIRFYRPFWLMNSRQFLIQHVKRDAAMGNDSTATNVVNGGEDSMVGKKKFGAGNCCMA